MHRYIPSLYEGSLHHAMKRHAGVVQRGRTTFRFALLTRAETGEVLRAVRGGVRVQGDDDPCMRCGVEFDLPFRGPLKIRFVRFADATPLAASEVGEEFTRPSVALVRGLDELLCEGECRGVAVHVDVEVDQGTIGGGDPRDG